MTESRWQALGGLFGVLYGAVVVATFFTTTTAGADGAADQIGRLIAEDPTPVATASHTVDVADGGSTGAARPENVARPKVTRSGRRLVCSRGTWSESPSRYRYQWRVNGKRTARASGRSLRITRAMRGRKVQCGVTATNAAGSTTAFSRALRVHGRRRGRSRSTGG